MITISLCGTEIVVRPKTLLDYVEKLDFIKSRRATPYDLARTFLTKASNERDVAGNQAVIAEAMRTVYCRSSSVSSEEQIEFEHSKEGRYYDLWRCCRLSGESPLDGINRIEKLYNGATEEERSALILALNGVDERNLRKNSDGPSVESTPGSQE